MNNTGIKKPNQIGDTITENRGDSAVKRKESDFFFYSLYFTCELEAVACVRAPLPRIFIAIKC